MIKLISDSVMKSDKVKIVELIYSMTMGGGQALVKDYALFIDENKFDLTILVANRKMNTANEKQLEEAGKNVIYAYEKIYQALKRFPPFVYKICYRLLGGIAVRLLLNQINPGVIHEHLSLFGCFSFGRIANKYAKKHGVKIFSTIHNEPTVYFEYSRAGRAGKRYLLKNKNIRLIALHDNMRKELDEMFHVDNTVTILNGINMQGFKNPTKTKQQVRSEIGILNDDFVIGHIGRFAQQKNHAFLIEIFSELLLKNPDAHLLLVGDGKLKEQVCERIDKLDLKDKVTILENRKDVSELMHAMDIFVFPSRYEGLGIVLIEAQAAGLRCVVSDKVPEEVFVTDRIIPLSLDASPQKWCDTILNQTPISIRPDRLDDYDMRNAIKKLERLYLGEI